MRNACESNLFLYWNHSKLHLINISAVVALALAQHRRPCQCQAGFYVLPDVGVVAPWPARPVPAQVHSYIGNVHGEEVTYLGGASLIFMFVSWIVRSIAALRRG